MTPPALFCPLRGLHRPAVPARAKAPKSRSGCHCGLAGPVKERIQRGALPLWIRTSSLSSFCFKSVGKGAQANSATFVGLRDYLLFIQYTGHFILLLTDGRQIGW